MAGCTRLTPLGIPNLGRSGAEYVTTVNNATGLAFHPWMSTLGTQR